MLSESEITRLTNSPAPAAGDTLDMLAGKLLSARIVKEVPNALVDLSSLMLESGKFYSIGAVEGNATLTRPDNSTTLLYEGVVLEFVTSDVIASVTAPASGKVQLFIY